MAFTPQSKVYLLDTPLDNKYKNTLHFEALVDQDNYFTSRIKHSFEGVTYQRKNNTIRVNEHIDNLWNVNYVMYQNSNFTNKWFYAFIVKMEYVNNSTTDIFIETDVYQTWLFNVTLKESFVVREHVADDTIGLHLVDEQLELGEYVMSSYDPSGQLGENWNILAVSDNNPLGNNEQIGNLYGNVVTGLTYFPFPNTNSGVQWLKDTINTYTTAGKIDAIVMIFTVPKVIISPTVDSPSWFLGYPMSTGDPFGLHTFDVNKQLTDLDGYTPKNNKMHTSPFKFFYVTNCDGLSAKYPYEYFNNPSDPSKMSFMVFGSINPSPKVMLAPSDYKSVGLNYEYGLTLSGYPLASWNADTYNAWLAQNGASSAIAMIGSTATLVGGLVTGNPLAIGGGALSVAHELSQIHQATIQPDQAKGQVGNGNIMYGTNSLDFYFANMTIKAQYAKRIDSFFTMYGYKVNTLKVPETHSRRNWNYIQTIDANISGGIPAEDMEKLKSVYNDGITLWHDVNNFLDYSVSNPIL